MSNPEPDPAIAAATDIKSLSDAAWKLFQSSMQKYQQISLDQWQMAAGDVEPDVAKMTKNATAFYANVLRDMTNLGVVWQKAANLAAATDPSKVGTPKPGTSTGTSTDPNATGNH